MSETDPAPSIGERIFHDPVCKCGHKKNLHAGAAANGRCVNRSCGCGKYGPREDDFRADPHHDPAAAWAAGDDRAYGEDTPQ